MNKETVETLVWVYFLVLLFIIINILIILLLKHAVVWLYTWK